VNNRRIGDLDALERALRRGGRVWDVTVSRGGRKLQMRIPAY